MSSRRGNIGRLALCLFLIWLCLLLYLFNSLWLKGHSEGFLWLFSVSWFSDLLAPVVMLAAANIALMPSGRAIIKLRHVLPFALACGLFWELGALLAPEWAPGRPGAVFDPADFIAYLAGGLLFWLAYRKAGA